MIQFGETLRAAREAKGLDTNEAARRIHLIARQVEALENEDFSRIAAPIYGRGFVKLYCQELGLDPQPLIEAFMEIYTGKRPPARAKSNKSAKPEPAPQPRTLETRQADESTSDAPAFTLEGGIEPPQPDASTPLERPAAKPLVKPTSRFAAPMPQQLPSRRKRGLFANGAFWRFLVLGAAAALILWGVASGLRKVYDAAMSRPASEPAKQDAPAKTAPLQTAPNATPRDAKRVPMQIPSLYID